MKKAILIIVIAVISFSCTKEENTPTPTPVEKCTTCTETYYDGSYIFSDSFCGTPDECSSFINGKYAASDQFVTWTCTTPQ